MFVCIICAIVGGFMGSLGCRLRGLSCTTDDVILSPLETLLKPFRTAVPILGAKHSNSK